VLKGNYLPPAGQRLKTLALQHCQRNIQLVGIFLILVGCSIKPIKPLAPIAGIWNGQSGETKLGLWLAKDGTFILGAGNSFAFGALQGTYKQASDTITLNSHILGESSGPFTTYVMHYQWTGPDAISTFFEQDPTQTTKMTRDAPAPATASVSLLPPPNKDVPGTGTLNYSERQLSVTCLSNLKELAMGSLMYAQDWNEMLPQPDVWHDAFMPYVKREETFTCAAVANKGGSGGYAYNSEIAGMRTNAIGDPAAAMLIFETETLGLGVYGPSSMMLAKPRHDGKVNVAYVDGHVNAQLR